MEILSFEEQTDGSGLMMLNLKEEEIEYLIGYAVKDLLKKKLKELEGPAPRFAADPDLQDKR